MVQGYESNSELADYYAGSIFEYETNGGLVDQEARIEQVTVDDLHRVSKRYLGPGRAVVFREVPTLTHSQLYMGLIATLAMIVGGAGLLLHKRYACK